MVKHAGVWLTSRLNFIADLTEKKGLRTFLPFSHAQKNSFEVLPMTDSPSAFPFLSNSTASNSSSTHTAVLSSNWWAVWPPGAPEAVWAPRKGEGSSMMPLGGFPNRRWESWTVRGEDTQHNIIIPLIHHNAVVTPSACNCFMFCGVWRHFWASVNR